MLLLHRSGSCLEPGPLALGRLVLERAAIRLKPALEAMGGPPAARQGWPELQHARLARVEIGVPQGVLA